jgi:hypothetical protein
MKETLILEIPVFHPDYKEEGKYGVRNTRGKRLKEVLEKCSEGYCMYCYSRVRVDRKLFAHLEHAIEKTNSPKLAECIPNIGLACPACNQIFKKIGEKKRALPKGIIQQFEEKCEREQREKPCTEPCTALKNLQNEYHKMPESEIILQPIGKSGDETGNALTVQYDVLKLEFQPANHTYKYSEKEKKFIETHIRRFRLNDPEYRTRQLYEFIKAVIDNEGRLPQYEYNNLVVEEFYRQISDKTEEEILKICECIYCSIFLKI